MATTTIGHTSFTYIDQSGKSSVQRLGNVVLNAGNIAAQISAFNALLIATNNMSAGTNTKALIGNLYSSTPTLPSAPASRSDKFAVTYVDGTTGDQYTTQIPVAKISGVTFLAGTRLVKLDDAGVAAAYVTAFQAYVLSEDANSVTIKQIRWVGRHI
jgi:hypothetical protein